MKDDFNFFLPVEFEKASSNQKMAFNGLASTDSKDTDGETLIPKGFDLSDFNWVNWNHDKSPKGIIGEPTEAIVKGNSLFIKGELYDELDQAKDVYNLFKALRKSKKGNNLKLSIEGKALERDLIDPKKILRAKITAVAICPTPKNGDTWVDFISKGYTDSPTFEEKTQGESDQKSTANGGESTYLIDTSDKYGNRITVDRKSGKITIEKMMTTSSAAAIIPESLEDDHPKDNVFKSSPYPLAIRGAVDNIIELTETSRSDAFKLYRAIGSLFELDNEQMYNIDSIRKGLAVLEGLGDDNITKGSTAEPDKKTQGGGEETFKAMCSSIEKMYKGSSYEDVIKAMKKKYSEASEEELEKAYNQVKASMGADDEEDDEDMEEDEMEDKGKMKDKVEKSEAKIAKNLLKKGIDIDIISETTGLSVSQIKDLIEPEDAIGQITKSMESRFDNLEKGLSAMGNLVKALVDGNSELQDLLNDSEEEIENLKRQPQGRKSIQSQGYIQKSSASGNQSELSVTNKGKVLKIADTFVDFNNIEKSEDTGIADAIALFESTGSANEVLRSAFRKKGIELVG